MGGAQPGRDLTDAKAFEAMIGRVGAELILHGHNHVGSVAHIPRPARSRPGHRRTLGFGAQRNPDPSGGLSALHASITTRAVFSLTAETRGLLPEGDIGAMGMLSARADPEQA